MSRRSALITVVLTLTLAFGSLIATQVAGITPQLGLDLQGGFSVVLEAPEGTDEDVLDKAVEIMRRRIEALGNVQEPEIAVAGSRNIVVQLPGVTDRDRAIAAVGTTGQLEFRPVLDISPIPGLSPLLLDITLPTEDTTGDDAADGETAGDATSDATIEDLLADVDLPRGVAWCDPDVDLAGQHGCVDTQSGLTLNSDPTLEAFLATDVETAGGVVYHLGPASVLGADLSSASAQFQQTGGGGGGGHVGGGFGPGEWIVLLDFNSEGADKFTEVTKELASFSIGDPRRQFAIVLDNVVQSAPQIAADVTAEEGISGGQAVITVGSADNQQDEASELAIVLRYGSLPVAFEQASVQSVSATLGEDSLQAGLIAGIGGLALVAVAMVLYYRALGIVNVIGLAVFGSLVLVVFSLLGEWQGVTLTLAGVAGVIVSVGITSDSYIVYYERIKEEVHKGRSLRAAIDHAFARSFRTILTADTVSFAGAVLLFFLAIGSVKGFALALLIATVIDVFVAYFFTRPAVALVAQTRLGEGGRLSIRGATGNPSEVTV